VEIFHKIKNIVVKAGEENSVKIEFRSFLDLLDTITASMAALDNAMKVKEMMKKEKSDTEKIAENLAKMIKEAMEKAPKQLIHFGEITKDGEVRELTPEEFEEKYLKGKKRKRGEGNE